MANVQPDTFYVGGRYIPSPNGEVMVGQMYVRRYGSIDSSHLPVVLIHGGAQSGSCYEQTPDGRPGLAALLADRGRAAYVIDLPGVGRSRHYEPEHGRPNHYGAETLERLFTAPSAHNSWPDADLHTQWPGTGRIGDPIFDAFFASQVGHFVDSRRTETDARVAGVALLTQIGPCHILTHSQGAPPGWQIADEAPHMVASIVALEPNGPPYFDVFAGPAGKPRRPFGITAATLTYDPPLDAAATELPFEVATSPGSGQPIAQQVAPARSLARLADIPTLVVTAEASYHAAYDDQTVDFLRQAGVPVTHVWLADHGIRGNGHLMIMESNNHEIAALIAEWLDAHQARS